MFNNFSLWLLSDGAYFPQKDDHNPPPYINQYPATGPQVFVGPVIYTTDGQYVQQHPGTYPTAPAGSGVYPGYPDQPASTGSVDAEAHPSNFGASFSDANIRRRFIRNVSKFEGRERFCKNEYGYSNTFDFFIQVYSILMVQLLVTLGFICLFVFWYVQFLLDWLIDWYLEWILQ